MTRSLVLILNHDLPAPTDALYEQLAGQSAGECDLLVMDNGSLPDKVSKYTGLRLEENALFGGALNEAFDLLLRSPHYDSLLFLNNDLVVETPNLVATLRAALAHGHMLVSPSIRGHCAWPQMRRWTLREIRPVTWVDFIAPMFQRRFVEHVGRFDSGLAWGWGQDVLSGLICEELGWSIGVCDSASVFHIGRMTSRNVAVVRGRRISVEQYRREATEAMTSYFASIGRMDDLQRLRENAATYRYGGADWQRR
jgi:GT2 family glycosyltransferase